MPDDLQNFSLRLHPLAAVGSQLHHDLVSAHGVLFFSRRNIDIPDITLIVRPDKPEASALLVKPDDLCHRVGEDPDDLPLPAASPRSSCNDIFHLVAVKRAIYIIFRDENIFFAVLRGDEPEASGIRLKDTLLPLCTAYAVFSPLGKCDLSLIHKTVQNSFQLVPLLSRDLEHDRHLPDLHGHIEVVFHKIINYFFSLFKCLIHRLLL